MTPITPRAHRWEYLAWKLRNRKEHSPEFKAAITNPNLRCISCGCKYNFQKILICPKCSSDKSYFLENEDPWSDPVLRVTIGFIAVLIIATRPIWNDWIF
jgi:hypothetical protein